MRVSGTSKMKSCAYMISLRIAAVSVLHYGAFVRRILG